ncbi:MAG: NAD(P)/FAD-dependent oxidoreductase [Candidatus Aminicenantes bacterium]|nr:NAD(P)/FAD-dependent oxidoreductase [Candidatus Aminicenantes bacterium]
METVRYDAAVIGGGEAGIAAAVKAAELGARVCLIESSSQLGGACVATGTLPSKTFSISAGVFESVKKAKNFGVRIDGPISLDFKEVVGSRNKLMKCDIGVIHSHLRTHKVEWIQGWAVFLAPDRLRVTRTDGTAVEIETPRTIVAAGSHPISLPALPVDGTAVITTDEIVALTECPRRVVIIGAGIIGCEYAFIFRTFGADVTLIEKTAHALLGQDKDVVAAIEKELKRRGAALRFATTVVSCAAKPEGGRIVTIEGGTAFEADLVLTCIGRRPSTERLGLEAAGVALGGRGEIIVDECLETTASGIFAAGDVIGRRMQSSTAILEGAVAAENAMGGSRTIDERFVPGGIYTQPEIGSVGLTEDEAIENEIPHIVGVCGYAALVKACSLQTFNPGFIKMLFDPSSHKLIGAHILGAESAELIHNLVIAMRTGATAEDFIYSIYHHPSLSEGFRDAARDAVSKM